MLRGGGFSNEKSYVNVPPQLDDSRAITRGTFA
jgi:hypothetical protein